LSTFARRTFLKGAGAAAAALPAAALPAAAAPGAADAASQAAPAARTAPAGPAGGPSFGCCLNTATIRGQKLSVAEEVQLAAKAGYGAIEPWLDGIRRYQQGGGSLQDLRKRIADLGLAVPSAISFFSWMADDDAQRAKGLEQAKADMDLVRQIGGTGIAAPPAGLKQPVDLLAAAERYKALLKAGDEAGVVPQLEIWGTSPALSRIGQAAMAAIESGHPQASLILDVYHIYKSGSDFGGLRLLSASMLRVFHMNDYPADPPRQTITDAHRVFPGDGVAPLKLVLGSLRSIGFRGWLSLELFNKEYWQRPAEEVARAGLARMKAAVGAV